MTAVADRPAITLRLPRPHAGQQAIIDRAKRINVVMCGRRFGKSTLGENRYIIPALGGYPTAYFGPNATNADEMLEHTASLLAPVTARIRRRNRKIVLTTGGEIDFWSLEVPDAGRGRKYKTVVIDEAGVCRNLKVAWEQAIRPTLTDYMGEAWVLGTPRAIRYFVEMHESAKNRPGWASFSAKSIDNPTIPHDDIHEAQRELPEDVFAQEYEGVPSEGGGNPFGLSAIDACIAELSDSPTEVYGIDLARKQDWSVVVGLDAQGRVTELHRWQSEWGETVGRIERIIGQKAALADQTGVGDPIVQALQGRGLAVTGFTFTAPSKQSLMSRLVVTVQQGNVRFPEGVLADEMRSFGYELKRGLGVAYSAPSGMHDDCVCAFALAVYHWTNTHLHAPEARWI